MRRMTNILMAAALTLGLAGTALANDRGPTRRVYTGRAFVGRRGAVTPFERIRIREARRQLRRVEWFAMRDGIVTRWERVRIHQARQRLAWLVQRAYNNGGSW